MRPHSWIRNHRSSLTLVELLAVCGILLLLAALVFEGVTAAREAAIETDCVNRLRQTGEGFLSYYTEYELFPTFAPPLGLGDKHNWADIWQHADPMNQSFCTNQTKFPRVPRMLREYTGDIDVLHCPSQGATAFWCNTGPFHYNTTHPWDGTNNLWIPKVHLKREYLTTEPLAACTRPPEVAAGEYSWRHGEKKSKAKHGINHHLYADHSVKTLINPQSWDATK